MSILIPSALRTQANVAARPIVGDDLDRTYRYWRRRVLATTIVGYALYYFVRANDAVPVKAMQADLHLTKAQIGLISTVGGVTYGVSKFANGFLGDHANPRYFMAIGLLLCAAMNVAFGASSALYLLIGFWTANMWAQGMGFPPCAKTMAHWFSPGERARTFGVWHTSHMIGGALISALTGYLVVWFGWRSCYYIPAAIAAVGALIILWFLRDTPGSLGLPPVEVWRGEETPRQLAAEVGEPVGVAMADRSSPELPLDYESPPVADEDGMTYWQVVVAYIFKNPYMWLVSVANFLVYVLRWVLMKWGPTFLQEAKGISLIGSGWLSSGAELAGMVSALLAGWATDRYFGGKAGRVCAIAMVAMTLVAYLFWRVPSGDTTAATVLFLAMGFLIYIPQMLIAAMAMQLGTKRASAAAVGLTGLLGYLSTIVAGYGVGAMADRWGWNGPFALMIGCAAGTAVLLAFTWNVGAHPHAGGRR